MNIDREESFRRKDAAHYIETEHKIPCKPSTLAKYATMGGGPKFRLAGRFPLYPKNELDSWALSKLSPLKSSSSDVGSVYAG